MKQDFLLQVKITKELNERIAKEAEKLNISKSAWVKLVMSKALEGDNNGC